MPRKADDVAAQELYLHVMNDRGLYESRRLPYERRLQDIWKTGKYDSSKAIRGWERIATEAAKQYMQNDPTPWHHIFNTPTRRIVAEELEAAYHSELAVTDGDVHE